MEPEAAFRSVVEQLQRIPNVAERAYLAEEIFGGTSEKLAGIINLTNAEFKDLEDSVRATTDIWSQEGLDAAEDFDLRCPGLKGALSRAWLRGSSLTCFQRNTVHRVDHERGYRRFRSSLACSSLCRRGHRGHRGSP